MVNIINKKNRIFPVLLLMILGSLSIESCSNAPEVDAVRSKTKTILTKSFPLVRIEYEYDRFLIKGTVNILEGLPTVIKAGIYKVDSLEKTILTRTFQPFEDIEFMVPRNLLLENPGKTILKIQVTGDDYESYSAELDVPIEGNLELPEINIKLREILITGSVKKRSNGDPLIKTLVTLQDSVKVLGKKYTNQDGNFEFILPGSWYGLGPMSLKVDTDGYYLTIVETFEIDLKKYHNSDFKLGPSSELTRLGSSHRIKENMVPFRLGPENGAPIKFFLGIGEPFVVSKVAGDRFFGFIETLNDDKNLRTQDEGWVLSKYLELIQ